MNPIKERAKNLENCFLPLKKMIREATIKIRLRLILRRALF